MRNRPLTRYGSETLGTGTGIPVPVPAYLAFVSLMWSLMRLGVTNINSSVSAEVLLR